MRFFFLIIVFGVLFISGTARAQVPEMVTYKDYLQQVLNYYPSLKGQYVSIEKAMNEKALAASARVPQLWASADYEYGNDPVYVFGALLRQNRFSTDDFSLNRLNSPKPLSNNSASIEGQWLLFDFSQTAAHIKSAGLLTESAKFQAESTRMEAILAASELYSRLALTQELLIVIDKVAGDGNKDVNEAESLSHKGLVLGADFYLARMTQTKLLQTKNEISAQQAALSMAFNILRGVDPAIPVAVTLDFQKLVNLRGTVQEWIDKSINNRLDIKAMEKELEAQGIEASSQKKSFLPKISAYGQASGNVHGIGESGGGSYAVGLKATMDIFDPGYGARVKLAKAEVDRLENQYQEAKDQGARDTAEIYYRLQALKSNVQLAIKARDDAKEAARLMDPLYREGKRSIEQMISVRAGFLEAYEQWLRLENTSRQSILSLKFYAGELDSQAAEGIYEQ